MNPGLAKKAYTVKKIKILIVEDESEVGEVTKYILERLGYAVISIVSTGEEAIKIVGRMRPDLVLMDIVLKGDIDGINAAEQIHDRFKVPVVYLTAYADEDKLQRAKVAEPYGYILKPFKVEELHATIEMTLYKHELENKIKREVSTTLRSIGDAVITVNKEGLITFMNPVAESLTGWKQEAALNRDLTEVFNIKDKKTLGFEVDASVKSNIDGDIVSLSSDSILTSKEKTETHIEFKTTPIRDDKGIATGFVLVFRDITERKQAEEALRENEERFKVALKNSPIVVWNQDKDLRYTWIYNPHPGFKAEETIGKTDKELLPTDDAERLIEIKQNVLKSGIGTREEVQTTINGETFYYDLNVEPLMDSSGAVVGITCASSDITKRRWAEENLRESEEHYRSLVESSDDPIYLIDRDMKYLFANRKFLSRLGNSQDEVVGQDYSRFHSPDGTKEFSAMIEKVFKSGKSVSYEHKSHRDGRVFIRTLSPVLDPETGKTISITIISKDITDLRRLENNLRLSEEKYRRLFETAQDGVLLANAKTGEIIDVNPYLLDFFKLSFVDLKGKKVVEVIPFSTMPGMKEGFESIMREGFSRFATSCFIPCIGKIFMEFVNSIYTVDGISIVQCNVRDITEIKKIQHENIKTLKYLEHPFINVPIGILSTDSKGKIVMSNPVGMELLSDETIEGLSIFDLSLWQASDLAKRLRKVLETGGLFEENDFRYLDKDRKQHIFFLKVSSLKDIDGKIIGILVLMREITDLKKMEENLFQAEKMASIGQLASGVAHKIRNPLAVIKSTIQFCIENFPAHSEFKKALEVVRRSADAADGMIFELLNFARPKELKLERHIIHDTIDEANRLVEPDFLQKKIEVQKQFYCGKIIALYDEGLIMEVLINILFNSIQAMKDCGKILITTDYDSFTKYLIIIIEDNGYGISNENIKKVFDPFFSTKKKGTGLGLSICHKIMSDHKGSISIDSEGNKGTKVTLTLPAV